MVSKVEKYVTQSFTKNGVVNHTVKHLFRTAYWLKVLKPEADDALVIAALSHDIERAFHDPSVYSSVKESKDGFKDEAFLENHQTKSAEIIAEFLANQNTDAILIEKVKDLVLHHEKGGTDDQNLIKDADSISFFENNVDFFLANQIQTTSKEIVKDKIDWMYNRITSEKAKQIVDSWYHPAIEKLDKIN